MSAALRVLERARAAIHDAQRVAVLTGAGISAESGIATFRDASTGLWAKYRPEDLATPEAFLRDPDKVWQWYAWRRERVRSAVPNAGHLALAELESRICAAGGKFLLATQNVDGLHQAAGSRRIVELHGNIRRTKCFDHGHPAEAWSGEHSPPRCAICGSALRPDVVWFGEPLPAEALEQAVDAATQCEVFLSVGTSTLVEPAASLPFLARDGGATLIEVNPMTTPLTPHANFALAGRAGEILPGLVRS